MDYAIQFQSRVPEALEESAAARPTGARPVREAAGERRADDRHRRGRECRGDAGADALSGADGARLRRCCSWSGSRSRSLCALTADRPRSCWPLAHARARRRAARTAFRCERARAPAALVASPGGARGSCCGQPARHASSRAPRWSHAVRHPGRVLGVGLALAALGWGLDAQTQRQTDLDKLVPQDSASLRNLNTLERLSGVGGEIDLMVGGKDVCRAGDDRMDELATRARCSTLRLQRDPRLRQAQLCPAFSLPDLFQGALEGSRHAEDAKLTSAEVKALLAAIPPYFSQDVIAPEQRVGDARVRYPADAPGRAAAGDRSDARRSCIRPRGSSAQLVGLPVLAAQADAQVASPWRRLLTLLAGLVAVALVLLVAFRGRSPAGVGAAGADRARQRLVGADPVRSCACR